MGKITELLKDKYKLMIPPTVYYELLADVVEIEEQEPKTGKELGMTIDLAIEELESTKDYPASDPASDEALDFAISTMRKYQQIEKIMSGTPYITMDEAYHKLVQIWRVIDGNDD